jgi:hypothetical protein
MFIGDAPVARNLEYLSYWSAGAASTEKLGRLRNLYMDAMDESGWRVLVLRTTVRELCDRRDWDLQVRQKALFATTARGAKGRLKAGCGAAKL